MKWFKHLSSARDDERIAQLEDVAGLEGYGFYFKLLEIVAQSMDGTDRCEVGYSVSRWATLTNCHPIKARTLVGKAASCGLVESRLDGDRLVVRIPNLLKFRDNHTKNLQAADKQEVDKEKEKETTKPADAGPVTTAQVVNLPQPKEKSKAISVALLVSDGLTEQTAVEFLQHRKGKKAPLTPRAWEGIKAQAATAGWTVEQAVCKALARGWVGFESSWVNNERADRGGLVN